MTCLLKLAGMEGFEPSHTEPESAVLPLDDIPTFIAFKIWQGREDLNPRISGPKPGALPLGDGPTFSKIFWRRGRDSNPRRAFDPHTLSRRAPSASSVTSPGVIGGGRGTRTPMGKPRRFSRPLPYQLGLVLQKAVGCY